MAKRAERRRLRQPRFEQPVIDRRHAEQHGRLEALHRLGDARRGGPALQQDVARAHAQRREHVADRIGEVKARGREQPVVLRAAEHLLVILRAHADVAVMMLDRLRHAGRARRHHPERRIARLARHRHKRRGGRGLPGGQIALAADQAGSAARPWRSRPRQPRRTRHRSPAAAGRTMPRICSSSSGLARLDIATAMAPTAMAARCIATMSGVSSISMPTRSPGRRQLRASPTANWLTRCSSAP